MASPQRDRRCRARPTELLQRCRLKPESRGWSAHREPYGPWRLEAAGGKDPLVRGEESFRVQEGDGDNPGGDPLSGVALGERHCRGGVGRDTGRAGWGGGGRGGAGWGGRCSAVGVRRDAWSSVLWRGVAPWDERPSPRHPTLRTGRAAGLMKAKERVDIVT